MKIKAYELKGLVEKKAYSSYLVYGQNKGLVSEKSRIIIDSFTDNETEIIKFENDELVSEPEKLSNEFNTFSLTSKKRFSMLLMLKTI